MLKAVTKVILIFALAATMITPTYAVPPPAPLPLWTDSVATLSVALSADGQYAVVGTPTGVRFYGRTSSTPLWTLGPGQFTSVAISSDGSYVAAANFTTFSSVYFWVNAKSLTGNPQPTWKSNFLGGPIEPRCLTMSDDGDSVAACGTGPNVFFWGGAISRSGTNQLPTWNYQIYGQVEAIAISSDGNQVAAVGTLSNLGTEGVIDYWNNAKSLSGLFVSPTWSAQVPDERFVDVAMSDDGNYVTVAGAGTGITSPSTIYYWADALTRIGTSEIPTWMGGVDVVFSSVDISCDGDSVVAGAGVTNFLVTQVTGAGILGVSAISPAQPAPSSNAVYFWANAKSLTGTPSPTWTYETPRPVYDVAINDAGTYMAAVDYTIDSLYFFDNQGNVLWENPTLGGDKLSISCDGKTLLVGTPVFDSAYLYDTGYLSPCCGAPPIPEYPLGLALLAAFMVVAYGLVRRRVARRKA